MCIKLKQQWIQTKSCSKKNVTWIITFLIANPRKSIIVSAMEKNCLFLNLFLWNFDYFRSWINTRHCMKIKCVSKNTKTGYLTEHKRFGWPTEGSGSKSHLGVLSNDALAVRNSCSSEHEPLQHSYPLQQQKCAQLRKNCPQGPLQAIVYC